MFNLAARASMNAHLYILDGGNQFQGYELARCLRQITTDVQCALHRISLSRVFTCYQMETLLIQTTFSKNPVLVLDFLATFYDQSVPAAERRRLLYSCVNRLKQISQQAPLVVWARTRRLVPEEAVDFVDVLRRAAGVVVSPIVPAPAPGWRQPALLRA